MHCGAYLGNRITLFACGYVVSVVLVLVTDSMTFGGGFVLPFFVTMTSRLALIFQFIFLLLSILFLSTNNNCYGIFNQLFEKNTITPLKRYKYHPHVPKIYRCNYNNHSESTVEFTSSNYNNNSNRAWIPFQGSGRAFDR